MVALRRSATIHSGPMIGCCYVLINDRRAGSRWSVGRQLNSPDVLAESSPFLRRLVISIFKGQRWIHRPVTLHGDTTGSRGVCSLLLLWASTHTQLLLRLMMESWCITAELWDGQQSQTERSSSYLLALLRRPCSPDRVVLEVGPPSSLSSSIVDWRPGHKHNSSITSIAFWTSAVYWERSLRLRHTKALWTS